MSCTLSVPIQIIAEVHEIDGGGYWAEVPRFPGCVAQAETIEALKENIVRAVDDWLNASPVKTEDEARQLAEIQGSGQPVDELFPEPYRYQHLRPGPTRMSSGETASAQFPIRFADIIFAEVLEPNGHNPKTRLVVGLTPDIELAGGFPIVVAGVTGTLPDPLTAD